MIASRGQKGVKSLHYVNTILLLPYNLRQYISIDTMHLKSHYLVFMLFCSFSERRSRSDTTAVMQRWMMLPLTVQSKLHITLTDPHKTCSSKVCKCNNLVSYCTLPRNDVCWNALKSDVQSKHRLSHTRRGVAQPHQIPSRCEREVGVGEGKLRERKEGEQARAKRKGVSKRDSFDLTESQKHKFFPFFSYFSPSVDFFPPSM